MSKFNHEALGDFLTNQVLAEQTSEAAKIPDNAANCEKAYLYGLEYISKDNIPFGQVLAVTSAFGNENAEPDEKKGYVRFNANMTDMPDRELEGKRFITAKATWNAFRRTQFAISLGAAPDPKDVEWLNQNQKKTKVEMNGIFLS